VNRVDVEHGPQRERKGTRVEALHGLAAERVEEDANGLRVRCGVIVVGDRLDRCACRSHEREVADVGVRGNCCDGGLPCCLLRQRLGTVGRVDDGWVAIPLADDRRVSVGDKGVDAQHGLREDEEDSGDNDKNQRGIAPEAAGRVQVPVEALPVTAAVMIAAMEDAVNLECSDDAADAGPPQDPSRERDAEECDGEDAVDDISALSHEQVVVEVFRQSKNSRVARAGAKQRAGARVEVGEQLVGREGVAGHGAVARTSAQVEQHRLGGHSSGCRRKLVKAHGLPVGQRRGGGRQHLVERSVGGRSCAGLQDVEVRAHRAFDLRTKDQRRSGEPDQHDVEADDDAAPEMDLKHGAARERLPGRVQNAMQQRHRRILLPQRRAGIRWHRVGDVSGRRQENL
jgi:hypothetical protein